MSILVRTAEKDSVVDEIESKRKCCFLVGSMFLIFSFIGQHFPTMLKNLDLKFRHWSLPNKKKKRKGSFFYKLDL